MLRRLGYACITLSIDARSSHGTVLRLATPDRLRELIAKNLAGLRRQLEFNAAHDIHLFRISSDVIPFGGHPANDLAWWEEFAPDLAALGDLIAATDQRVSMHPGQYTLLSSPDERITEASVRDLVYHARFLDALGVDQRGKLVVHGGGAYGDKPAALARWAERYAALPACVRRRLVVENDERIYTVADLLGLSEHTGVPVVLDTLHHRCNPGPAGPGPRALHDLLRAVFQTWAGADGPPKTHFSSQSPDRKPGAHADHADPEEFIAFLHAAPDEPFDCMLEAKAKDHALFRLRDALASSGHGESTV
jgi:UV DNA damage endonuclease